MESLLGLLTGITLAAIGGRAVSPLLAVAAPKPSAPQPITTEQWAQLLETSGGPWIGMLERYLCFGAFWVANPAIVLGWFTFKLAAKWEAWKNVVQVPSTLKPDIGDLEWFVARRRLGSYLSSRFLAGTLANVLIGWASAHVGREAIRGLAIVLSTVRGAA